MKLDWLFHPNTKFTIYYGPNQMHMIIKATNQTHSSTAKITDPNYLTGRAAIPITDDNLILAIIFYTVATRSHKFYDPQFGYPYLKFKLTNDEIINVSPDTIYHLIRQHPTLKEFKRTLIELLLMSKNSHDKP